MLPTIDGILARVNRGNQGFAFAQEAGTILTKKKQRTVITAETVQFTVIQPGRSTGFSWCELCAAPVWMLTADAAAVLKQTTLREIFRRLEAGELHFVETGVGELLICSASLGEPF